MFVYNVDFDMFSPPYHSCCNMKPDIMRISVTVMMVYEETILLDVFDKKENCSVNDFYVKVQ